MSLRLQEFSRIIRQHLIIRDYSLQLNHATLIHDLFIQLSRLTLIQVLKPNLRRPETSGGCRIYIRWGQIKYKLRKQG